MTTQDCWQILGIEPTSDEKTIKLAYAKQLKTNRPDRNSEGFIQLRSAYEDALHMRFWICDDDDDEEGDEEEDNHQESHEESLDDVAHHEKNDEENEDTNNKKNNYDESELKEEQTELIRNNDDTERETETEEPTHDLDANEDDVEQAEQSITDDSTSNQELTALDIVIRSDVNTSTEIDSFYNDESSEQEDQHVSLAEQWREMWDATLDESDAESADSTVQALLSAHFDELKDLPIDEENEVEIELIYWFNQRDERMPVSFEFAFKHFNWQNRLEGWDGRQYPWVIIQHIKDEYNQVVIMIDEGTFFRNLLEHNPDIHTFMLSKRKLDKKFIAAKSVIFFREPLYQQLQRWHFFYRFLNPIKAFRFTDSLIALEKSYLDIEERATKTNASAWRNHNSLVLLKKFLFGTFIKRYSFVYIMAVTSLLLFVLPIFLSSYGIVNVESFYQVSFTECFVVAAAISSFLMLWQLILKLMVNVEYYTISFNKKNPFCALFIVLSVIFYIRYSVLWLDDKHNELSLVEEWRNLPEVINYIAHNDFIAAHLLGIICSILLSLSLESRGLKVVYWYQMLLLVSIALILPMIASSLELETNCIPYNTPLLWGALAIPFIIYKGVGTNEKLQKLKTLAIMVLFGTHPWFYAYALLLTMYYCVAVFIPNHLVFSGIAIGMLFSWFTYVAIQASRVLLHPRSIL